MFESAAKPRPIDTPSRRAAMAQQSSEAHQSALRRYQIAKLAYHTAGSYRHKRSMVITAMKAGLIAAGPTPAVSTVRGLQLEYAGGARSVSDFVRPPRLGRRPKPLAEPFRIHIEQAIREGSDKSARELHRECRQIAAAQGCEAPSHHQVNKAVKAGYRLYRAAARHGSRAGEIDGLPHGRIATQFVHDVWCLDELTFPVWIRVPSAERAAWTSVLTDIVIIVDVRSTAVVGWHIVDPVGRVDEHGVQLAGGARVDDVFAALLSAAFTELAPDSTAQFAGFLPAVLRWDNHQAHKALAERLRQAEIGIDPFFIRKRRAISNSPVENRVGTLKRWTKGIKGHVDRHLPTDQVKNDAAVDQVRDRTRLAGSTSERRTERLPLDPCDLMDVAEARIAFNDIVRRYNFEHINRVFNQTAAQRFFRYLQPRHPRNGRDLLGLIEPRETTVGRNGIVHYEDNCEYRFDGIIEDAILMLDSTVIYRPDPLVRCLFVEREGRQHVLFPTLDVAERAATIARNQIAIARYLSDTAKEAREARYVAEIGSDARARAEEQYKHQQELYRNGGNGTAELAPNIEALRRAPEPEPANEEFDPYGADNLHAFVRRRNENGAQSDE